MRIKLLALASICASLGIFSAQAQDAFATAKITAQHVSESVHMLTGMGGNIGVSAGSDGLLVIDDQYAPMADKIVEALGTLDKSKVKYLINTHYHGDHTGSNAYFKDMQDSTIFAHENVRNRLAEDAELSASALPVVTYDEGLTFHFNGETIQVMHLPAGHTDSDSVIWFKEANVLHAGDLFFEGRFPYIDLEGGGTVSGYIKNVQSLLTMLNGDSQIIPGHGNLATKADYQTTLNMMIETAAFIKTKKNQGVSLDDLIAVGLGEKWQGWSWDFITEEKWISTLYKGQ
ncbi:MBL fold metallo-hydrolase [Paraglaciecola sp.]|uniref:MBL fold metallo-hydrolase n=1 Tax=Paraglaciecola sp. TaxID=1920173 RepID=UPI0030F401DA